MKVTYVDKGQEHNHMRIDTIRTFHCLNYWQPENCSLIYFRLDRFNLKAIAEEDIIRIEF